MRRHLRSRRPFAFESLESRNMLTIGLPGDGFFDLTFIGDKYVDMGQFHQDVGRAREALLDHEPFKSRSDQIRFHAVENTASLGSARDPAMPRLMSVDQAVANSLVEASGQPTDFVIALVNDPEYGGSGGGVSVTYNGSSMADVLVHEFAHSFGLLRDEYLYGQTGELDGKIHGLRADVPVGNLYAGTPPAPAWSDLVAPDEYFPGGEMDNWYRTSLHSEMRDFVGGFNSVSLLSLISRFEYWAGPSPDREAPTATIANLRSGDSVSGVVSVAPTLTDNRSVIIAQLWVDGRLARTSTQAPFALDWTTGNTPIGAHSLYVRAFDASGNVAQSTPIQVNLTAGADIQIVGPAENTPIVGQSFPLKLALWPQGVDHVDVQIDGASVATFDPSWLGTQFTVFLPAPLSTGAHTLTVVASVSTPDPTRYLERYRTSTTLRSGDSPVGLAIVSPGAGSTVKGVVPLAISAGTFQPVRVQYYLDGILIGTSAKAPFALSWNSKKARDGAHQLRAVAWNAAGAATSAEQNLTVKNIVDRKAPTVAIARPKNNAKYSFGDILVSGTANDNVAVASVSLYVDNILVATSADRKFSWLQPVADLAKGKHKIRVAAIDSSGNKGWSSVVTVRLV